MTATKHDDGGPALVGLVIESGRVELTSQMSLRDYFAGRVFPTIHEMMWRPRFPSNGWFSNERMSVQDLAALSYEIADAMLAERNRGRI